MIHIVYTSLTRLSRVVMNTIVLYCVKLPSPTFLSSLPTFLSNAYTFTSISTTTICVPWASRSNIVSGSKHIQTNKYNKTLQSTRSNSQPTMVSQSMKHFSNCNKKRYVVAKRITNNFSCLNTRSLTKLLMTSWIKWISSFLNTPILRIQ